MKIEGQNITDIFIQYTPPHPGKKKKGASRNVFGKLDIVLVDHNASEA